MTRVIAICNNFQLEVSFNGDLISIYHEGWITTTMVVGIGELSLCTSCDSFTQYEGERIEQTLYVHSHFNLEVGQSVVLCFNDNNQMDTYVRLSNKAGKLRWKVLGEQFFGDPNRFQGEWMGKSIATQEEFDALIDDEVYPQSCKECFDFLQQCKKFDTTAPEWVARKAGRFEDTVSKFLVSIEAKDFDSANQLFVSLEGMIPSKDATWLKFKTMLEGINPSDWLQE